MYDSQIHPFIDVNSQMINYSNILVWERTFIEWF